MKTMSPPRIPALPRSTGLRRTIVAVVITGGQFVCSHGPACRLNPARDRLSLAIAGQRPSALDAMTLEAARVETRPADDDEEACLG